MKKLIKSISVLCVIFLGLNFQACKKPRCPEQTDPCKNTVKVTALEADQYAFAHFSLDAQEGMLFATNWSDYASKVVPGNTYQIAYQEVQCKPMGWCGTDDIRQGGCFPNRKCIQITCLKEVAMDCYRTVLNPATFSEEVSSFISGIGITGNSLKVKAGFSGCENDLKSFQLYLQQIPDMSAKGNNIWIAKVVNTNKGVSCMAYFQKNVCFDLSAINTYYMLSNIAPSPKEVTIRFMIGDQYQDFDYKLQ